jgi:hypothetical protein
VPGGPASPAQADPEVRAVDPGAGAGIVRGYLQRLASRLDGELGVGDWPGADVVDILLGDMEALGVTVASLDDEPPVPAGHGREQVQATGLDRSAAMSYLMEAGVDEVDSDEVLDLAVISAPVPAVADRLRVTWSRGSGFTVTGPALRQVPSGQAPPATAPLPGPGTGELSRPVRAAGAAADGREAAERGCAAVQAIVARYRRGEPEPDPDRIAAVLAMTAWQAGNVQLAEYNLGVAFGDNTGYSMALLLRRLPGPGREPDRGDAAEMGAPLALAGKEAVALARGMHQRPGLPARLPRGLPELGRHQSGLRPAPAPAVSPAFPRTLPRRPCRAAARPAGAARRSRSDLPDAASGRALGALDLMIRAYLGIELPAPVSRARARGGRRLLEAAHRTGGWRRY